MKRIIMMVIRNIFLVPWMWARLCYHASHVDKYSEEEHYRMLQFITHRANKGGNVTIDAHGLENIPKENGFIFFPNHQGLYDVLSLVDVCPKPFSVVAKKEVENVPFLKQVFKCMKAYMMDRSCSYSCRSKRDYGRSNPAFTKGKCKTSCKTCIWKIYRFFRPYYSERRGF